jgi:hypothetical protein
MKKILFFDGVINDIVNPENTFEVCPEMLWLDAPDDVTPWTHEVIEGVVQRKPAPVPA